MLKTSIKKTLSALILLAFAACQRNETQSNWAFPATPRQSIEENIFGKTVADPYRWLENLESDSVRQWAKAQDEVTRSFLNGLPFKAPISKRLQELSNFANPDAPVPAGDKLFYLESRPGLDNPVLVIENKDGSDSKILIDPNQIGEKGSISIRNFAPSPDGRYVAYLLNKSGSRYSDCYIRVIETGQDLPDVLPAAALSRYPWAKDASALLYQTFETINRTDESFVPRDRILKWHKLGTPTESDQIIYGPITEHRLSGQISNDSENIIITIGSKNHDIYLKSIKDGQTPPQLLLAGLKQNTFFNYLGNDGVTYYFHTNQNTVNGKIIKVNISNNSKADIETLIPDNESVIRHAFLTKDFFVIEYLKDCLSSVAIFDKNGNAKHQIDTPIGLVWNNYTTSWQEGFTANRQDNITFFKNLGLTSGGSVYQIKAETGKMSIFKRSGTSFQIDQYETKVVYYMNSSGQKVPMFLTHKKGLKPNGKNPLLLFVYGANGFTAIPFINEKYAAFLEMGGIHAMPNIRGGGGLGDEWYTQGIKENKPNGIQDALDAAQWLIDNHYTSSEKMVVEGNSAGTVIAAGAVLKKPALFGAAILEVPLGDMIRHTRFIGGAGWIDEFGNPEVQSEFEVLYTYSPYHHIKNNQKHPPILIAPGAQDFIAPPLHGYKLAAAFQHAYQNSKNASPALLRVNWGGDHAGGTAQLRSEERIDELVFLAHFLKIDVKTLQ